MTRVAYIYKLVERMAGNMIKRIFSTKKDNTTPNSPHIESGSPSAGARHEITTTTDPDPVTSPSPDPTPSTMNPSREDELDLLDLVKVFVDARNDCGQFYEIERQLLISNSKYFERHFALHRGNRDGPSDKTVYLRQVTTTDFQHFYKWLCGDPIIDTDHGGKQYAIDQHASRLVRAINLGVFLESQEYQRAAVREFLPLGPLLEWPEDYVNEIFDATKNVPAAAQHIARRMIVAIVAGKTSGEGKRKPRKGPKDQNIDRDDEIVWTQFWEMYERYIRNRNWECKFPESVDEFSAPTGSG